MALNDAALAELFRMGNGLHTSIPSVDISVQQIRDKDRCAAILSELAVARKKKIHLKKKSTNLLISLPEYKQNSMTQLELYHFDQVL